MSRPQLSELTRRLKDSDPRHRDGMLEILGLLREMSDFVRLKNVADVASCLDASIHLVEVLGSSSTRFDRTALRDAAATILDTVREGVAKSTPPKTAELEISGSTDPASDAAARETGGSGATARQDAEDEDDDAPAREPLSPEKVEELEKLAGSNDGRLLGQLLIELGHVNETQVADALAMHRERGIPTGECLLLNGATSPEKLLATLRLQDKLRAEAAGLDAPESNTTRAPLDLTPAALPSVAAGKPKAALQVMRDMFIGEVLLGAEMITAEALEQAMRIHHHEGTRVGEALIALGALTEQDLESALELQSRLRNIAGLSSSFDK